MKLVITRYKEKDDFTIGRFVLLGNRGKELYKGVTLEPNGPDTTTPNLDRRIPQGKYRGVFEYSSRYNGLFPVIYNSQVSKDRRILIHHGNYGKDTLGCILLGEEDKGDFISHSKKTIKLVFDYLDFNSFDVEIINDL